LSFARWPSEYIDKNHTKIDCSSSLQTIDMTAPFRFLALSPEIRNIIVILVVSQPETIELQNVAAPPITAVGRQVRAESMAQFFWENTFRVRVFTDVAHGELWAIVAGYEPSLSLVAFLRNNADDPDLDVEMYAEMRRQTMMAGRVLLLPQTRTWLESLPQGIVNFRWLEFAISDDLELFWQVQPAENMVGIYNSGDAGFRTCLS
jgi:hypothetical protein